MAARKAATAPAVAPAPVEDTAAKLAETLTPEPVTLATILDASSEENGLYTGNNAVTAELAKEAATIQDNITTLVADEGKRSEMFRAIAVGLWHFASTVMRKGTKSDTVGPDWSRESDLCKRFYGFTVTASLDAANASKEVKDSIGNNVRWHVSQTREQFIRAYVDGLTNLDGSPLSDEGKKSHVEAEYARFGLKVPGSPRAAKNPDLSAKTTTENPGAALQVAAAAVTASDKKVAPAILLGVARAAVEKVVAGIVTAEGHVEGMPEARTELDSLYMLVSALHEQFEQDAINWAELATLAGPTA